MRARKFIRADSALSRSPANPASESSSDEVSRSERLDALASMSQGLAHEINNALSPVLSYAELLLEDPSIAPAQRAKLEGIVRGAARLAELPRKLELFYGQVFREAPEPLVLAPLIRGEVTRLSTKYPVSNSAERASSRIELSLDEALSVTASPAELRRLVVELINNAIEASPAGAPVVVDLYRSGSNACLEVRDTGGGMTEDWCARCVEPFQSTKNETGTGLGLSICLGIVQRLAGSLQFKSAPGSGTTVTVILPVTPVATTSC